jgi:hypothetical protein
MSALMGKVKTERAPSFSVRICIAGDHEDAKRICKQYCFEVGYCVTVEKVEYIYTGGHESGVIVGLINYPRFPRAPGEIIKVAEDIGMRLMEGLFQHSFSIITPTETIWYSRRPE